MLAGRSKRSKNRRPRQIDSLRFLQSEKPERSDRRTEFRLHWKLWIDCLSRPMEARSALAFAISLSEIWGIEGQEY